MGMDWLQLGLISVQLGSILVLGWIIVRGAKNAVESAMIEAESFTIDLVNELKKEAVEALPILASKAAESMKYSLMGQKSGDARLEKGMNEALVSDVINQSNPLIGMIMDQFPQGKEYLAKHPDALPQILDLIQKFTGGQGAPAGGGKGFLPALKGKR